MMYPQIRCYHEGAVVPPFSFFILCKGCNAGKPDFQPWTNSFIAVCSNQQYFDFFFWLVYGLHQSGKFKTFHRGSVIPFINLEDVRQLIREVGPLVFSDWIRFQEIVSYLDKLRKLKATLTEQVNATEQLQRCLLRKYFSEIKNTSE